MRASSLTLNFNSPGGTILDANGIGTGFTARMPLSGQNITGNDPNLFLHAGNGVLQMLTSPGVDLNGQVGVSNATIVGIQLSTLGFTGNNDFQVTGIFKNITNSYLIPDQLCVVVGTAATNLIRAGFINFSQFHSNNPPSANEGFGVNTVNGGDIAPRFFGASVGSNMTVVIGRQSGTWSVKVNNVDRMPNSSADGTGTPAPPTFLDTETDLFVGVIAMDVGNDSPWYADLDTFTVNVSGNQPPTVTTNPQKQLVNEGDPAIFTVVPGENTQAPIYYEWRRNGVPIPTNQNSATLVINPFVADAGNYTVLASNTLGMATSSIAPLYVVIPTGKLQTDFNSPGTGVLDTNGVGIGLPVRMGGTGTDFPGSDTNLFLNTANSTLDITTTSSDYNGGNALDMNESLGVQLSTLGFSGSVSQDLNASAYFPQPFPATAQFDQFGVVVGQDSLAHTRAGSITFANKERFSENVQTNNAGVPVNGGGQYFGFAFDSTIPMSVLITRQSGVWHYYIDGIQWDVLAQPTYLNDRPDFFAGVFAEDVVNGIHKTFSVDNFTARVFDPPNLKISTGGGSAVLTWNVAGAVLQSNTRVDDPSGWTTVTNATSPFTITGPLTGTKYYRTVQ
jgi:hypothetical protein